MALYDCHSIRSVIPRLFEGELPVFHLGTNSGASASPELVSEVETLLAGSGTSHRHEWPLQGRLDHAPLRRARGGRPRLQMEIYVHGAYMREAPGPVNEANWPAAYDEEFAAPDPADASSHACEACLVFARSGHARMGWCDPHPLPLPHKGEGDGTVAFCRRPPRPSPTGKHRSSPFCPDACRPPPPCGEGYGVGVAPAKLQP